ncbi:MAG: TIGR02922 family protein [Cognaticolwellia sp.]
MKEITIIFYGKHSLELKYVVERFPQLKNGRVIIPESYKQDKSIIAVCEGHVNILNSFGERIEFFPKIKQAI